MTGELQETVDKTAPCSAITEKRPNRLGGCVGVFFQLFDWNRRFAKKKLFPRKSLLPGKQASKRFGRDDKMLKTKLALIDDENRGSFPNRGCEVVELKKHDMRSPSLVARLMGLESLPSNHRDKGKKKKPSHQIQDNNDICGLFDEGEEEEGSGFDKSRPQKMQKTTTTGVCDRRGVVMVKKFGSEAMQIKNVSTRVRKQQKYNSHHHQHQKLASPVRSPRLHNRRNSRLIDAATRILEPGKRNAKYSIPYPGSSGVRRLENVEKEPVEVIVSPQFQHGYSSNTVASCKACGSFVDVHSSSSIAEEIGRSKRNVFLRNQEPSMSVFGKGRGFTDPMEKKALPPARFDFSGKHEMVMQKAIFPPVLAQSYTLHSKRGCSSSPVNAISCKDKDFVAKNRVSTSRNYHHSKARLENSYLHLHIKSHTSVEESTNRSGTSARKRRLACASGQGQGSNSMSLVSRRLDAESSCACSNETAFSPLKHGSPHSSCRETKERKGVPTQMCGRNLRTTLDASFSNESCFSNSFDNISVPGQMRLPLEPTEPDWDVLENSAALFKNSTSSGNHQAIASLISHVSNVLRSLSNTGLITTQQRFNNAREVILHTELSLGTTTTTTQDNYIIGPELFDELMIYAARSDNLVNLTGITGGFLVDAMIEHLEERNISCGLKPSPSADAPGLIRGVLEEVPKWAALARIDMDEIIHIEMEKWMDLETHSLGVGAAIAYEILCCLVGELAMELF